MSEQQFTIESERINTTYSVRILKDDEVIFEISNWDSLGGMHKTECENIVALLNELYEERNYFERKKREYWNKFNLVYLDNINLRKENEQLKCINDQLEERLESSGIGVALKMDCVKNE